MSHFDWDWVGVIHGDDDYGNNAFQSFLKNAEDENVCTAFIETLPYYLDFQDIDDLIEKVVQTIRNSTAKVVILILREEIVHKFFTEVIKQNISRTWIASDTWAVSYNISLMQGINNIGDIFGFSFITGPNPGFKEYLQNVATNPNATNNKFIEEYLKLDRENDFLTNEVDVSQTYAERLAVLSIAYSLRAVLKCNQTVCSGNRDFLPYEVSKGIVYN